MATYKTYVDTFATRSERATRAAATRKKNARVRSLRAKRAAATRNANR